VSCWCSPHTAERFARRLPGQTPLVERSLRRFGARLTLVAIAFTLIAVPFGLLLDQVLRDGALTDVDTAAAEHLHQHVRDSPGLVQLLQVVSFLGKPLLFCIVCIPVVLLLLHRRRVHLAVFLASSALVGGLVDTVIKVLVDRDRPVLDDPVATAFNQSFPSGHSMMSVVIYGALLLIFMPVIPRRGHRLAIALYVALCLAIGFSRLALGVHYISDVVGGWVLGAAWLMLEVALFEIWRDERGLRRSEPLEEGLEPEAEPDLHVHAEV